MRGSALSPAPAPRQASPPPSSPSPPAQSQSLDRRHNGLLQRTVHPHLHMHVAAGECPLLFLLFFGGVGARVVKIDIVCIARSVAAGANVCRAIKGNVCKVVEMTEIGPDVRLCFHVSPCDGCFK